MRRLGISSAIKCQLLYGSFSEKRRGDQYPYPSVNQIIYFRAIILIKSSLFIETIRDVVRYLVIKCQLLCGDFSEKRRGDWCPYSSVDSIVCSRAIIIAWLIPVFRIIRSWHLVIGKLKRKYNRSIVLFSSVTHLGP